MFIAKATMDLKDIKILDRVLSFKKGVRFIARDGLLYEQIRAGNVEIIAETREIKNEDIEGYIEFENESNQNIFSKFDDNNSIETKKYSTTNTTSKKTRR